MELMIRPLSEADLEGPAGLEALRSSISGELANERGGPLFLADRADRSTASLIEGSAQGSSRCDIVLADGALVGWAYTTIRHLVNGSSVATIEEIAVDAQARAIGAGEALLDATLAWCRAQGCDGVDSFALPGARETKNFFETFGLKARLLTVHLNLRDEAAADPPAAEGTES